MNNQQTLKQKRNALEFKAFKIGVVIFAAIFVYTLNFFVACFIGLFVTCFFLIPFFVLKAGLPLNYKPARFNDDDAEARHKTDLINMPVISSLSVYHNAGSGYQMYQHHSQFHR